MTEPQLQVTEDVLYCEVHPTRQTTLRCNKCGRPMCTACAVRTPVGYRCRECVREQQDTYFTAVPTDYLLAGIIALVLGAIGAVFASAIGFFYFAFLIGPAAGALIADLTHRAVGRRRGRYTWLVVGGGIVLGALLVKLMPLFSVLYLAFVVAPGVPLSLETFLYPFADINWWIYVVLAPGAAIGRLRIGSGIRLGR